MGRMGRKRIYHRVGEDETQSEEKPKSRSDCATGLGEREKAEGRR